MGDEPTPLLDGPDGGGCIDSMQTFFKVATKIKIEEGGSSRAENHGSSTTM